MKLANSIKLCPTKRSKSDLHVLGDRVSRLWNAANYKMRESFFKKTGVPVGAKLEKLMLGEPEYRQLPSDVAQEVLKKLSESWKSYFALREKWAKNRSEFQKPGLPAYRKDRRTGQRPIDYIPLKCDRAYSIDSKDVHIVLPRDRRSSWTGNRLNIAYRGRCRYQGKMGRAELRYDDRKRRRWSMNWTVKLEEKHIPKPVAGDRTAAIDLGVRISASLSIEGLEQALHFESREALKDWDYFGRAVAREQQEIAGTRGNASDKRAPSSREISKLYAKRRLRLDHAMKCLAKRIAETCAQHDVSLVYLGHPKNILRDVSYGSSTWAGRIHGFWSFDKLLRLLENALTMRGIRSKRVGERGTSSTCPSCGSTDVKRSPRWALSCGDCGEVIHSDQAGSRNILKQNKPSVSWDGVEATPRTETLRWDRHLWVSRSANPRWSAAGGPEFPLAA